MINDLVDVITRQTLLVRKYCYKSDNFAMPREKPAHEVNVDGFFIDATEVTNKQFKQ
jgi:formylglycine-generating enzyme required for sulfatase activity